jgi:hypothetical protein
MLAPIKPETVRALAAQSLAVQQIRAEVAQAEAEVVQARTALSDLPPWAVSDILERGQERLQKLQAREAELLEQAERSALRELQEDYVQRLKSEAEPKLAHAASALETVRKILAEIVEMEREARSHKGAIMTHAFDKASIGFFVPILEYVPTRNTWTLRRQN